MNHRNNEVVATGGRKNGERERRRSGRESNLTATGRSDRDAIRRGPSPESTSNLGDEAGEVGSWSPSSPILRVLAWRTSKEGRLERTPGGLEA